MAQVGQGPRAGYRASNGVLIAAACILTVGAAIAPFTVNQGVLRIMIEIAIFIAMTQMWNLLAGYAGLVSMGHQLFVGAGAYTLFVFSNTTGISPYWSVISAPILCAVLAAAIAPFLFRLRDAYFAIGIWVVAEMITILVSILPWFGRSYGVTLFGIAKLDRAWFMPIVFWLAYAVALGSVLVVLIFMRKPIGLGLMAVRDNEHSAASLGVSMWSGRFWAFIISGAITGLAGAVYYLAAFQVVPSSAFNPNWAVQMLFITIIGGIGNIFGPIVGVAIYFVIRELFVGTGNWYLIILGGVGAGIVLLAPKGLWGSIAERTGIDLLPVRRIPFERGDK